jgi:basic membrane lipoprotein Med (substrate-binding protein (PBP1-ABC) superfamily)
MRRLSGRVWCIAGAVLVAVALVTTLVVVLGHRGRQLPPPRARQYRAVDACLLTGSGGLADPPTAAVWAGMQDASLATRARVSYLPVVGPDTVAAALPFAQSLIQRHCAVVVAVGQVEVGAAAKEAPDHSDIRFVLVGGTAGGANVSVVAAGPRERVRPAVAEVVTRAVGQ